MSRFAIIVIIGVVCSLIPAKAQEYEDRSSDLPDSAAVVAAGLPDSLDAGTPGKIEKIKVVRRKFRYGEQVGAALGMMAFLAIIFTTAQQWNPD